MHSEQEVSPERPRYAGVRAYREARNGTGLKPPEAHTGAQLVRFYARRDNKDRQDDACCP
ncbi:hypothetical protein [Sorangium sp. So ce513]|uniref:hypothetical protein n=1 Tax=Sorangium sp. So ce513 TaxID=3133315 RepID=UPI003F5EF1D9